MSTVLAPPVTTPPAPAGGRVRMTVDEFLALPEDEQIDRDLIRGELWEEPRTFGTWEHSSGEGMITVRLQQQI